MAERPESRKSGIRTAAEQVFAVLTGLSLLGSLAAMLSWSHEWVTPMWLTLIRCAAAATALVLWNRRDAGFRILAAYLALAFLRLLIPSPEKLFEEDVSQTFFYGIWAFMACYPLGHILGPRRTERFLKIFLTGWVFCMACHSVTALYAAWTDQRIWNIGAGGFWGLPVVSGEGNSRLRMLFDANTSGILFCTAAVAAFLCAAGCRNKWMKAAHILLLLPNWTALSLTDSRTAQVSAAAGIGTAAGILILRRILKNKKKKNGHRFAWPAAVCGALATAAVCLFLLQGTTYVFSTAKTMRAGVIPCAAAEEANLTVRLKQEEVTAGDGETVLITAKVKNAEGGISYQWQYSENGTDWKDLTYGSAYRRKLKVRVNAAAYERSYRCVVTAENGTAATGAARIVRPFSVGLSVRTRKSAEGDTMTITATAEGAEDPVSYRWLASDDGKNWTELPDSTKNTLTVDVTGEKRYRCAVTAGNGTVLSKSKTVKKAAGTAVEARGLGGEDPLTGRPEIWGQTLRYLGENPKTLLIGRSVRDPLKNTGIMRTETIEAEHCHNMFLQMLMECGIPGLLLLILFMICTGRRAVRLVKTEKLPLLQLLPAAVCALWAGELTESIVRISNVRVPAAALLALYAGIVCATGKPDIKTKEER